jgi:serine O-acetyltransferase
MQTIIQKDLFRYEGKYSFFLLCRYVFFTPAFRYIYFFRKVQASNNSISRFFWKVFMRQTMLKTGIQIPETTKIDEGFRILHFGHIIVNPEAIIGKNFNISQGVTIGSSEGKRKGVPIIGNNVCIHANAVVVGKIIIGNDVLIAPNSFVNFDVPDGSIVVGNPGKIIPSDKPTEKYIVYKI